MYEVFTDTWRLIRRGSSAIGAKWRAFTQGQKNAVMLGGAITFGCWIAGPAIFPFAVAGILTNTMLWWIIKDSEAAMNFMRKYGIFVDLAVSVAAFFASGGFSSWMSMLLITSYFTIFRVVMTPHDEEATTIFGRIKQFFIRTR